MNKQLLYNDLAMPDICRACHIKNPEQFIEACEQFHDMLVEANKTTNLTRLTTERDFWIKHVVDSILIAAVFPEVATRELQVLDIGCGAGIPSLILGIAFPGLNLVAVDSVGKKIAFIADVASRLNLKVTAVHGRGRELNRKSDWKQRFDVITARAVAEAKVIYRETKAMLHPGGKYLLYKTPEKAELEIQDVQKLSAKQDLNWTISPQQELPGGQGARVFLYSQ